MISITNSAIVEKIKGTGRTFTLSIKVGTNEFTKVKSLRRSSIFASNQKLSVGEAVSAFIEAEINDCRESLQNYEVEPILRIDGYDIDIPLGIFKVQAPSQADGSGTQKITAYDRMSETSKHTYTATGLTSAKSTFSAICSTCGYTAVTSGLTDVTINDKLLNGMDCRKALGYIAGVFGKNCVVGTDGKFKMVGYSKVAESTCKISINSLDTLEFPSKVSTIDYFNAVVNESTIYKSGLGNSGVNIVNPLFDSVSQTANILSYLKSNVGSSGYYPAKFKQLNGDPRIEVGDVIKVEHKNIATGAVVSDYVPVMSLVLDYDGGVSVSIEAYPTESEFSMSLSDLMDFTNSSNNSKFENLEGNIGNLNNSFGDLNNNFSDLNDEFGNLNNNFNDLSGDFNDLSGKVDSFAGDILTAKGKADFATVRAEAVEELNKVIGNSLGLYQTPITGVGGDTKYYFHNKPTLAQSNYIISMTDNGFAYTNNWNNGNPVWTYGINPAGNSIMNYLVVNKISADLINAGVIKSLPGAPIETEFSLNTGLFTLDSKTKKERFGFGTNAYNNLMLQYNYSDSSKNNIKLGFYYNGNFYRDSAYTDLISPSTNYYYGDLPSGNFYQYASSSYSKMTNLTDVLKTYKGFILHSSGVSAGYTLNSDGSVLYSDFTAHQGNQLGGMFGFVTNASDKPDNRTPILKFYDYENEDPDGDSHYTAIRKQSIVTKYLSAEKMSLYLQGTAYDLESVLTEISNGFGYLTEKIGVLQAEIEALKSSQGTKTLAVYVEANPSRLGSITSGPGSYTLEDGYIPVSATSLGRTLISSVTCIYASDNYTKTYSTDDLFNNNWLNEKQTLLQMSLPIDNSRIGDTLNISVNFVEETKYTITLDVVPTGAGTVTGGGQYYAFETPAIKATANTGYEFIGWYQGSTLVSEDSDYTILVNTNKSYTAQFKKVDVVEEQTIEENVTTSVVIPNKNSIVYLKFMPKYTGTYTFESLNLSDYDPDCFIYDYNKNQLGSNTSAGAFSLDYDFEVGLTYYLGVKLFSGTGILNVKISYKNSSGGAPVKVTTSGASNGDTAYINTLGTTIIYPSEGTSYKVYANSTYGIITDVRIKIDGVDYGSTLSAGKLSADAKSFEIGGSGSSNEVEYIVYFGSSSGGTKTIRIDENFPEYGDVRVWRNGGEVTDSTKQYTFDIGDTVKIQAYINSGYRFRFWIDASDGKLQLSDMNPYTFTVDSSTTTWIRAGFAQ